MAKLLKENEDFSVHFIGPQYIELKILNDYQRSYSLTEGTILYVKNIALIGRVTSVSDCGGNKYCTFNPSNLEEYESFFLENQCSDQILNSIIEGANDYWTVVENGKVQVNSKLGYLLRRYVDKLKREIIGECNAQK